VTVVDVPRRHALLTLKDDDDDSKSYVRPLLQLETVTSVLVNSSVFRSRRNADVR